MLRTPRAQLAFAAAHEHHGWVEGFDGDTQEGWPVGTIWPKHMADADPSWPWWVRRRWIELEREEAA